MTERNDWHIWWFLFFFGIGCVAYGTCGCVDQQKAVNYIEGHRERLVKDVIEVARETSEDSPAVPFLKALIWRLEERLKPWTKEEVRLHGRAAVDVAESPEDNEALVQENRDLYEFSADIDMAQKLPLKPGSGWSTIIGVATGTTTVGGLLATLSTLAWRRVKKRLENSDQVRMLLHSALNEVKAVAPEQVKAATMNDPKLRQSYQEYKGRVVADEKPVLVFAPKKETT